MNPLDDINDDDWAAQLLADSYIDDVSSSDEEEAPEDHISRIVLNRFGFEAKPDQIRVIKELVFEGKDIILIAKTGFGKSIVYQAPSFMYDEIRITIVIMPLKALENDQEQKLERIKGCKPFVLNGDTNTQANRDAIRKCRYTHILTSPEIAVSKLFNQDVLRYQEFQQKLCLLAIDEVHLVEDWSSFRPDYMEIYVLRSRLPAGLPFLGLSATLSDRIIQEIKDSCGFRSDKLNVIKTPLDRPEIFIQLKPISGSARDLDDLHHLLPARATGAQDILKTIIFMESISSIRAACSLIRGWMRRLNYPKESYTWVDTYFSEMSDADKHEVAAKFLQVSKDCDGPRILIATDAYGLGLDNPDISRVVQYKIPRSLAVAIQRMGRAMRYGTQQAWYLFLYQKNMVIDLEDSQLSQSPSTNDIESSQVEPVQTGSKEAKASTICPNIDAVVQASIHSRCIREVILERLDAIDMEKGFVRPSPCCSSCDPGSSVRVDTHDILKNDAWCNHLKKPWFEYIIGGWRANEIDRMNFNLLPIYQGNKELVIPANVFAKITRNGQLVRDEETLRTIGGRGWAPSESKSNEVLTMLHEGQRYGEKSEEVRRADLLMKHQSYQDKQSETKHRRSESVLRQKARNEWQLSRDALANSITPAAKKHKREPKTPAKASRLSQVMSTPPIGILTPPSTVDDKENHVPLSQLSQHGAGLDEIPVIEIKPPKLKKLKRSTSSQVSTIGIESSGRVLEPSSTRQNRQMPKRFIE